MAAATMALSSCFAVAAGAPSHVVVGAGRAAVCFPRRRAVAVVVRAQSEPDVEPTEQQQEAAASSPATPSPAAKLPKAAKKPSTKLSDVLAFSGPAPERINGRLAMVGFVSALAVEASRGGGLLDQAGSGSGLAWFAATAAVLSAASLVPLLRGESAEGRSGAVMSADAELWNGRFAMLGLVALAFTEFLTGSPFVNV
ncbi:low molecular mass early light-inducible protein HV60, chloroplastic [Oryza brachyantha]|uniref:low molecular mass early light-inducible protein HV60, chloroplastic n=1 Tax=Oryza brachyantha TaxID=4533 RepID=UPI001AD972F2|nr:low molecular mass early light-inducible protein HV60, chloroplastic [Oryza brachyantha]